VNDQYIKEYKTSINKIKSQKQSYKIIIFEKYVSIRRILSLIIKLFSKSQFRYISVLYVLRF